MNSDDFIEKAEKVKAKMWKVERKLLKAISTLFTNMISYLIAIWIYWWVYDNYGFEKTIIMVGVGFIVFSLRQKVSASTRAVV